MAEYEVNCTTKAGADADRRIAALGGPGFATSSVDEVINWIKSGHTFWVVVQGQHVPVEVRQHANGREYVTTQRDGFPPNNLLHLPDCP